MEIREAIKGGQVDKTGYTGESGRQRVIMGGWLEGLCLGMGSGLLFAEVFETEPQLVVMPKELGVFWDLSQKHLGYLQRSLWGDRGS